ncbi:hypothetical protein BS50DRAFT_578225 [Corynespora cassiicola Philippines]|uniref:MARVEL domain-containing protein n=1 Tax=Corynespora cassiicola Philippines TaxID=1448308 RepID=A0A2T2N8Z0_CORCC|nr:hypothetical protein BS50DRAFT_578225 [Corynespora cassiicola Philippines]
MAYDRILKLTVIPAISLFIFSLVATVLTAHAWIITDWLSARWIPIMKIDDDGELWKDDVVIEYTTPSTDSTIVSGTLGLAAGVVGWLAWAHLRAPGLDVAYQKNRIVFWTIASCVTSGAVVASAIASIILHFTGRGDDEYGCKSGIFRNNTARFTNMWCTREIAACGFLKDHVNAVEQDGRVYPGIACSETTAVKWMQILLAVNALVLGVMFASQARQRMRLIKL